MASMLFKHMKIEEHFFKMTEDHGENELSVLRIVSLYIMELTS